MISIRNFFDNPNVEQVAGMGNVRVYEYKKDMSVHTPGEAMAAYFAEKMNHRVRQVLIELKGDSYILSAGAMQWTAGNVQISSDVKGVGDLFSKVLKGSVTNESAVKPRYAGNGLLMLEPTTKYILLENVANWNGLVLEDGMFLACAATVSQNVVSRANFSSAVAGGEGLFNLCLNGQGVAVLESPVPREELIEINLENDEVKIDGSMAVCWSQTLNFTVERSTKSLLGSAASGEGLVNVYRGTGKILMAPVRFR